MLQFIIPCIIIAYINILFGLHKLEHYKVKKFINEAKKASVLDKLLFDTLDDFLSMGKDSQQKYSLGAGLYKLRLASKEGRGKSGGGRSILAYKKESRVIWLHLFAKNEKGNISVVELKRLKVLSDILLGLSNDEIAQLIHLGELCEVKENV